jgi:hypothetical protein
MITWKQYKMALKATLHFKGGCLDVSSERVKRMKNVRR